MSSIEIVFRDRYGLHPRSAMRIQQTAGGFRSRITIQRLEDGGPPVDARSMIALVSSGIRLGERIRVAADGEDEAGALAALQTLIEGGVCHP
jgi:phosphotransferase system HPr (HPr) family protein